MFVHQLCTTLTRAVWQAVDSKRRRGGREAEGGGLLIHLDLFARTDFCLFC